MYPIMVSPVDREAYEISRPVPGTPTLRLDESNRAMTVEEAGLRGQTLIFDDLGSAAPAAR